jgi:UDP-N-acetylmuramoylalanine--D-glutamate ligase
MEIRDVFENKRVLIWGYGREGKSSESFIKSHCSTKALEIYEGDISGIDTSEWDLILKSPGIVMLDRIPKVTSQTEIFLDRYADQTVGITGTKGKSTTSSLMYEAVKACGRDTVLLGNIGKPCFDYIDEIKDDTLIVFELSCHQLMHIDRAPAYSIFLNLYPEHLDYYGTVEKYFEAKANITTHQTRGNTVLLGKNVPGIKTVANKRIVDNVEKCNHDFTLKIPGEHNRLNAEFVRIMAVEVLGLKEEDVLRGMSGFNGLPHRLEYVGEYEGVKYFDDSISTIPEAAINAVKSLPNVGIVLVGGMDRGIDYSKLITYIKENKDITFVLMYETGKRIGDSLGHSDNVVFASDLEEAVAVAVRIGKAGSSTVLSPAAASYGYFKNFEERGDRFKELVRDQFE